MKAFFKKKIKIYVDVPRLQPKMIQTYFQYRQNSSYIQHTCPTYKTIEEEDGDEKKEDDEEDELIERVCNSDISSCEYSRRPVLYVVYNPVHKVHGKRVYTIDTASDMSTLNFQSSYPSLIQTHQRTLLYTCLSISCIDLKRHVYEQLSMYQVHVSHCDSLFKCRLSVIISVIEQCENMLQRVR